jgi:hypothetical protein
MVVHLSRLFYEVAMIAEHDRSAFQNSSDDFQKEAGIHLDVLLASQAIRASVLGRASHESTWLLMTLPIMSEDSRRPKILRFLLRKSPS